MKTSELTVAQLDWAVAKCEGVLFPRSVPKYSTDWAQGGPIIERELIAIRPYEHGVLKWSAAHPLSASLSLGTGPTVLIAALRCFVASKLGDAVDIPTGLL